MMWLSFIWAIVILSGSTVGAEQCNWNGQEKNGKCQCFEGFYGTDCSGDCSCNGHGTCKTDHTCECEAGWKWSAVEKKCVWDCHCDSGVSCIAPGVCGCHAPCVHGNCWNGQCECWAGYKGATCNTLDRNLMMNKDVNVGMNLGGINYYSSEIKFVDVLKESEEWITQRDDGHQWSTGETDKIHWRDDGYPASLEPTLNAAKLVLRNVGPFQPRGIYTLLYDGEGDFTFKLVKFNVQKRYKGRWLVDFEPGKGGILVSIKKTNPRNPVRNIRLILPGFEDRYENFPFNPVFLESIPRYSVIRFMDFMHTNGHGPEPTTWATRRKADYHTQAGESGGALEYMLQLCNTMGMSPWFNMPHAADDDFVRKFAQEVKKTLRPDLHVYVEYSNEVWNGIFRQAKYSEEQGIKLGLETAKWKAGYLYYNKRASEVADIWNGVYGSDGDKLVPVWAWQTGYFDYSRQVMSHLGANAKKFKAVAVTGYMSCEKITGYANFTSMTMEQILGHCLKDMNHHATTWTKFLGLAKENGLKLLTYEAGPSVSEPGAIAHGASSADVAAKAIAFNKDDHIEKAVNALLEQWQTTVATASGNSFPGGLFNYFASCATPSKYGSWGMLDHTGQDPGTVPKYRGVQKFITKHHSNNPLGPRCSFIQDKAGWFGCLPEGSTYQCGRSDNNGRHWSHFTGLNQPKDGFLVLDGYNSISHTMMVRTVDRLGVNKYHTIDVRTHTNWTSLTAYDYYGRLSSRHVTRTAPAGLHNGLAIPPTCN